MKKSKTPRKVTAPAAVRPVAQTEEHLTFSRGVLGLLIAVVLGLLLYSPALNGPFLFDDRYLPFLSMSLAGKPLIAWLVGSRLLVNFSYWVNSQISGVDTWSYHVLNVILHACNSVLVFLIGRWFLQRVSADARRSNLLAVLAAALFLVHPLQTEAVAYVTSRSEVLAVFFLYSAYALFLYTRGQRIGWGAAFGVVMLFGAAQLTKEYAAVLPLLLLLTDWLFPGVEGRTPMQQVKSNWRLYGVLLAGVALGGVVIANTLRSATSAGLRMKEAGPIDYFLTECRVFWSYMRLLVAPVWQNIDPEVPFTHGLSDPFALVGLVCLLGAVGAAFYYRKRYRLASFGFLMMLVCLAPTSSFLPIADPFAEHRMYLPMLGAILIVLEFLGRWRAERGTFFGVTGLVLAGFALLGFQRNAVWGNEVALWQDTAAKSPGKVRPRFQLAFSYYTAGNCAKAVGEFKEAARLKAPTFELLHDWAEAEDCAGNEAAALDLFRKAEKKHHSGVVSSQIAMVLAKQHQFPEALEALDRAQRQDPGLAVIYAYRGNIFYMQGDYAGAAQQFEQALALDPENRMAAEGLPAAKQRIAARH